MTQIHNKNIPEYIRYIEEYIPKLHIHQHSLLTRKVFFRHNFQHWSSSLYQLDHLVFKSSSSSSHLRLQVIFIFKSSSNLDHLSIWIIITGLDMDHHSIWIIITGLDLDHHSIWIITAGSSLLDLDHHSSWINTGAIS